MITEDYLMKMLLQFFKALMDARVAANKDPEEEAEKLDNLVGESSGLDTQTFLSLSPESIALILQSTGTDPEVAEFMVRSLLLSGELHQKAGEETLGNLRLEQAQALAAAYNVDTNESLDQFLDSKSDLKQSI